MATTVGSSASPRSRGRKPGPRLDGARFPLRPVLESALIVLSVFLAFGLNEWRVQRADRALARSVLLSFKQEIESNLAVLERFQPQHQRLAEALAQIPPDDLAGQTAIEVVAASRVDDGTVIMPQAEAAWHTAATTGALRLLDYETAALLSGIYAMQRDFTGRTAERFMALIFDPQMFDPAATVQSLHVAMALLGELSAQESSLIGEYRAALRHLDSLLD